MWLVFVWFGGGLGFSLHPLHLHFLALPDAGVAGFGTEEELAEGRLGGEAPANAFGGAEFAEGNG